MARPQLALGTHGQISFSVRGTSWRARCRYRDFDGVTRSTEASGHTRSAALQALQRALGQRTRGVGELITPDSRFGIVAEKWYAELEGLSPSTMQAYRDRLDKQVLPALASVRLRELSVGLVDRHLKAVRAAHGAALAKTTKTVMSGVCGLATRHDALAANPCRDVARIPIKVRKAPTAFTIGELQRVRAWLDGDAAAHRLDLPNLVTFLAATGLRLGEVLALRWVDVDLEDRVVRVRGTVLRVRGEGLIVHRPKTRASDRSVEIPSWCVAMLTRRVRDSQWVFPAPHSRTSLRDPSNTANALRTAFRAMGVEATSHTFRKTVATLMDESGVSARGVADQLGHARPSITQDVYLGRHRRAVEGAAVLERIVSDPSIK